ncbi:hypothetical protein Ccrd_006059 [Cynara cardunculus var. scolymus]|uniref:Uncharacterized protein n=1 Tax=Cynara cardunculus var. scolymus TaxID=59895 RepID=A0A118JU29_CYNCS|nr:hypothetical protein Ccrd_006059 [Cynara cardunculus var. scolymus]
MWDTLAWLLFFFILIAILVIVVYQVFTGGTPCGRHRDLQPTQWSEEATAFKTRSSHFPPIHHLILDDI